MSSSRNPLRQGGKFTTRRRPPTATSSSLAANSNNNNNTASAASPSASPHHHNESMEKGSHQHAQVNVDAPGVSVSTPEFIYSSYAYQRNTVHRSSPGEAGSIRIVPTVHRYNFRTRRRVPKVGVMMV